MTDHRISLPAAELSQEVHIAIGANTWRELQATLWAKGPHEACCFLLTRPSRGMVRTTVLLREVLWPEPGEVIATPRRLEISANYLSRAMDAAIDAGPMVGLCLVHTHPKSEEFGEGAGLFSSRDDWYEQRLFPTVTLSREGAISASVVIGSRGDVDARVWWRDNNRAAAQPVHGMRIVGPELRILETPASPWRDHPDPAVMDRPTRLWGEEGRRRLQNIRIGVAGAGGTGSLTILALATMGTGHLLVWDKDVARKENRHRTAGMTVDCVGHPKVIAMRAMAQSFATAEPFTIDVIEDWATTSEGLTRLKDCDLVFCCVDKLSARAPLNDLAYAHLIPTIDMASWMHPDRNLQIDALMTHAHVWSPGIPCAWCRETLTSYNLTREAQGVQQGIEKRIPYGLTLDQTDGVEPSVLPLNMLGVSLGLMEFMQIALRITTRTPRDLKFFLPEWELDESDRPVRNGCDCVLMAGRGDTWAISPVSMDS